MGKGWSKKRHRVVSIGRTGNWFRLEDKTLADHILRDWKQAYDYGHKIAAYVAFELLVQAKLPLPDWVAAEVHPRIGKSLDAEPSVKKWARDHAHMQRYKAVMKHRMAGQTFKTAYESAAKDSEGQIWAGKEDAVEKSYKLVARTEEHDPLRYWHPQNRIDALEHLIKMSRDFESVRKKGTTTIMPDGSTMFVYTPPKPKSEK